MNLLDRLKNKRLIIITGKGGVGKTSVSAALALALAKENKKVLVCEVNANQKIPALFGKENHGGEIKEIYKNIYSVNILPKEAMREYGIMILKSKILYKTIFENKFVSRFLSGFPGLNELLTLGKIRFHEKQTDKKGRHIYDAIIVDAPATGHGLSLLRFPITILKVLNRGPLAEEEKKLYSLLTDPKRTSIQIVTLPEELPVKESLELREAVTQELKMPFGYFIFNSMTGKNFTEEDVKIASKAEIPEAAMSSLRFGYERSRIHENYLNQIISQFPENTVSLPYIYSQDFGFHEIEKIAQAAGSMDKQN